MLELKHYKTQRCRYTLNNKPVSPMFKTENEALAYREYCDRHYKSLFGPDLRLVPFAERKQILNDVRQNLS
jgi:hypothetical protein